MATKTEAITPRKVRDLWDKGLRATRTERQQAALNHWFLRNRMWVYYNPGSQRLEEVQRVPGRVRASVARVGPDSRRIIAKLMRRAITFDVPPSSPDDAAIHASRVAEAALVEAQTTQGWEQLRTDHAWQVWEGGVAAVVDEWDWTVGTPVAMDAQGRTIGTGEVKLTVASIHEMACEPGTRDLEHALWWVWGLALPPKEVQETYGLAEEPKPDARASDTMRNMGSEETGYDTPLCMVLTYFARPTNAQPGMVMKVVNDQVVEQTDWPFPYNDRLNLCVAKCQPIHGRWYGHTPLSDAVTVQALYNASWSSIVEHMKLAGVARLWCPMGSVDDIEELTDTPGEAVEYNAINGARPQYEAPPVMPDWWIRQPDMLAKAMDDILGVHDVSRGEAPSGVESGVALSILSENDDTPVGALAKEMGECWGRVASHVLKQWEANVRETRQSMVHLPGNVPEVIQWTGGDLLGQTTAKVPMDSVMPRSRAAQAAYALQLYDRKIIQSPGELAKVADLPDQDDLLAGIDPDTARAQRENYWLTVGAARTVDITDDHGNHIKVHRDFMRSERYDYLGDQTRELFKQHMAAHEQYAAGQGAQQATAASVSPMAAALPTEATKPITPEDVLAHAPMSAAAPSATSPAAAVPPGGGPAGLPPTGPPPGPPAAPPAPAEPPAAPPPAAPPQGPTP